MLIDHHLFGTVDKVADAIAVLKEYEPPEGYYVAFSGGKDSLCVYWLTKLAGVKCDYHYHFTTVDPPEVVSFVRTFEDVIIDHPGSKNTMWSLIKNKGIPPTRLMRYCCTILKESGGEDRLKVLGVRAEESTGRKGRQVVQLDSPLGAVINLIYHWTEYDVWQFIGCNLLDYCSLYDEGYDRLGCVGCPQQHAAGMERDFERWPEYYWGYVRAFECMLIERTKRGKTNRANWQCGKDVMQWWMYGSHKVDPNQQTLWGGEDDDSEDSLAYQIDSREGISHNDGGSFAQ